MDPKSLNSLAPSMPEEVGNGRPSRGSCIVCGTPSMVRTCLDCRKTIFNAIPDPQERRAKAMRARVPFLGNCEIHGETEHSWQFGACLKCFNASGAQRKKSWYSEAIDAGDKYGLKKCDTHNRVTPHSLKHRRCLLCYATNGIRRSPRRPVFYFANTGDELGQRRAHMGLDVDTFAVMLGVSGAQLQAWETGFGGDPTPEALDMARSVTQDLVVI